MLSWNELCCTTASNLQKNLHHTDFYKFPSPPVSPASHTAHWSWLMKAISSPAPSAAAFQLIVRTWFGAMKRRVWSLPDRCALWRWIDAVARVTSGLDGHLTSHGSARLNRPNGVSNLCSRGWLPARWRTNPL